MPRQLSIKQLRVWITRGHVTYHELKLLSIDQLNDRYDSRSNILTLRLTGVTPLGVSNESMSENLGCGRLRVEQLMVWTIQGQLTRVDKITQGQLN